jgi:hypothetical protein
MFWIAFNARNMAFIRHMADNLKFQIKTSSFFTVNDDACYQMGTHYTEEREGKDGSAPTNNWQRRRSLFLTGF